MISNIILKVKKKLRLTNDIKEYRKKGVKIGEDCKIYDSFIDNGHGYLIEIGNNCILTHCTVLSHDASTQIFFNKSKVGIVKIGDNCFLGWGSIILPNVKIGKNCIIGAGCVVSHDIPDNSIVVGNPCKIICSTEEFIKKHKRNMKVTPVFNTYWKKKTRDEKYKERKMLENTFGYDE